MSIERHLARIERKLDVLLNLVGSQTPGAQELLEHLARELQQSSDALAQSVEDSQQESPEGEKK